MRPEPQFFFFPGATPTLEFVLPVEIDVSTDILYVSFSQGYETVKEYDQDSSAVTADGNSIYVAMSQADTLKFGAGDCEVQLRYLLADGTADVSVPVPGLVGRTQMTEVLQKEVTGT